MLAALSRAVDATELHRAVREAMLARTDDSQGPSLGTWGQRLLLEALRGFDDDVLIQGAPHVHDQLRTFAAVAEGPSDAAPATFRPASKRTALTLDEAMQVGRVLGVLPA